MKKKIVGSIICTALIFTLGFTCMSDVVANNEAVVAVQNSDIATASAETDYSDGVYVDEIVDIVEYEGDVLDDEQVSLASTVSSGAKTTTKKTSKTTKSTGTLKSKATKSKTVTRKVTKKSTRYNTKSSKAVTTKTTTVTTTKTKYKKGSKKTNITKTVDTTVTTTTAAVAKKVLNIDQLAPKASEELRTQFKDMGYKVMVDNSISSTGLFHAAQRRIALRTADGTVVYHELGHFLSFITGRSDETDEWEAIYNAEKNLFSGSNKTYVTSNVHEYFAESYRDYVLNPTKLKAERPKTYAYVVKAVNMIPKNETNQ